MPGKTIEISKPWIVSPGVPPGIRPGHFGSQRVGKTSGAQRVQVIRVLVSLCHDGSRSGDAPKMPHSGPMVRMLS